MLLGDIAWIDGQGDEARRRWQEALRRPADEGTGRLLTAKQAALTQGEAGVLILRVLVGEPRRLWPGGRRPPDRDGGLDLVSLMQAVQQAPDLGLPQYLLGRQLYARGSFALAAEALDRARTLGLPDGRFLQQAGRLLGQAQLRGGDPQAAEVTFKELLTKLAPEEEGQRMELQDWIERAAAWPKG